MEKISNFRDYETPSALTDKDKLGISEWLKKYERYSNIYNNKRVDECISNLSEDACNKLGISNKKGVNEYIRSVYNLSEGLSMVMAPWPMLQSNVVDQVQHFQY